MIDRFFHLPQDAIIDADVIVRPPRSGRKRAACHQDDAPALCLDGFDLLFVGPDDRVDCHVGTGSQMVGTGAAGDQRILASACFAKRSANEIARFRPAKSHAALRRVHRFGNAEAEVPKAVAEGEGPFPVDGRRQPWIVVRQRVGDDMGSGKDHARKIFRVTLLELDRRSGQRIGGRSCRRGED